MVNNKINMDATFHAAIYMIVFAYLYIYIYIYYPRNTCKEAQKSIHLYHKKAGNNFHLVSNK